MLAFLKTLFRLKANGPCCPVCGCQNFVSQPFYGTDAQGVIGHDCQFACGFKSNWRGHRVALCSAEHPVPIAQAISQIAEATRHRHVNVVQ